MPNALGPEERELLEGAATSLFEAIAARGLVPDDDPLLSESPAAMALLRQIGLVQPHEGHWVAVDPTTVQGSVVAPMSIEGARLVEESSRWAAAFTALTQAHRRVAPAADAAVTELHADQITRFLVEAVAGASRELLTAQPQTGRGLTQLNEAVQREVAAMSRGVRMRTIYQHAARRQATTRKYVARVTAAGAEVRTLDEFFNRLIVIDREVALIPAPEGPATALVIRDTRIVAYLVDIFERHWERARPFSTTDGDTRSSVADEQRAMAVRMLIEGHSDPACAARMGVSERTYAQYIAGLKREYDDAETRFQLGYRMGLEAARRELSGESSAS